MPIAKEKNKSRESDFSFGNSEELYASVIGSQLLKETART